MIIENTNKNLKYRLSFCIGRPFRRWSWEEKKLLHKL